MRRVRPGGWLHGRWARVAVALGTALAVLGGGAAAAVGLAAGGAGTRQQSAAVRVVAAPAAPATGHAVPRVAPLHGTVTADALAVSDGPLRPGTLAAIRRLPGVTAVQATDAGTVAVDGRPAYLMGVDPSTFRSYTPLLTARSDPLWESIARGETAVSFDMGHNAGLPLGGTVPVTAVNTLPIRIGAFASMGIAGVDAVVSDARAAQLGLPHHNAVLISAPHADPLALRGAVVTLLPRAAHVVLLRRVVTLRDAGEYLNRAQLRRVIDAAWSRLGRPYVWGATGPSAFDCSGLVGWSFAQAGIALPRTAAQQFLAGPHVPYADARPGDLLFWTYDPTAPAFVDHVALYLGHGMMLVAAHTGTVVSYQPVPLDHLAGVVRVDPAAVSGVGGPRYGVS